MDEFTTYRILEREVRIEKTATDDGVKDVVKEAPRVPDGSSFHTRVHLKWFAEEANYGLGQHEDLQRYRLRILYLYRSRSPNRLLLYLRRKYGRGHKRIPYPDRESGNAAQVGLWVYPVSGTL